MEKEIAKLFATLGFKVEDSQLHAFSNKLASVKKTLNEFKTAANSSIKFSASLDKENLAGMKGQLSKLSSVRVKLNDVSLGKESVSNVKTTLASLFNREIKLKNVTANVKINSVTFDKAARDSLTSQLNGIVNKPLKLDKITIPMRSLKSIKDTIKDLIAKIDARVSVSANTKPMTEAIRAWQEKAKRFKLLIRVGISQRQFENDLRIGIAAAQQKVGTLTLKDPKVKVGIDKPHLRSEIAAVISQIKREVRIKIDLTGRAAVPMRGGQGGGTGFARGAATGGLAGAAMGVGRGFIPGLSGAFAVSRLTSMAQEFQSQEQAATAVMGNQEAGQGVLNRLRAFGEEAGIDYRSQAMPLLRMLSSGTNAGLESGQVENVFQSVARYGRVMGLDDESMKGSMRAIEQMLN